MIAKPCACTLVLCRATLGLERASAQSLVEELPGTVWYSAQG